MASRRDDAEMQVGEEGGGDQYAIEHVVQGVADEHQRAAGLAPCLVMSVFLIMMADRVLVAMVIMAMTPQQELLQHEEQRNAGDQRDSHLVHPFAARTQHRVRYQPQQRRA